MIKNKLNPHLEVIIAASMWGLSGVFIKILNLPPTSVSFFRMAIPTLILSIFFLIKKQKLFKGNNKLMLIASSMNAFRSFLYILAFTLTSIANSVVMLYTWPIFTTIFSAILLKEKVSRRNALLLFVAFLGVIFVYLGKQFSFANKDIIGMSAMLVSAAVYSLTIIIFKKVSEDYSKLETVFYQNLVGAIVFIPFIFINQAPSLFQTGIGITYATLSGLIAYSFFFSALKQIKASTVSFLSYIEVVSAIAFGILIFKELLTWNVFVGGILIIGSAIMLRK